MSNYTTLFREFRVLKSKNR